jgi:hypothetical protein
MKVALIGASGADSSRLLGELSRRGHFRLGKDQLLTNDKGSTLPGRTTRLPPSTNSKSGPMSVSALRSVTDR